ncbi:uncharacterized protein LOC130895792 [Diorhabda carinulata]|uniref:uncharacterized protein LOC130895792 n=1 Tax=Diorhabda carinulata TaxID=1163345 RepID=UPI0025A2D64E|nr:uncharacterized protein LOC130895792 [Diorhabda carinulata]
MELIDKKDHDLRKIITYKFDVKKEDKMSNKDPNAIRFRQIIPSVCASLVGLPFGLMLGWPSPTNPILMDADSPIPITMDQSAMIAGFLMIGNALGTPFCRKIFFKSKFGIIVGITLITSGWILMWQAQNIFWLLGSRLLVGFGNAYGYGQLKIYIQDTCDEDLGIILIKLTNLYVLLGIIIIFSFGPFIDFRQTSVVCSLISFIVFFVLLLLPNQGNARVTKQVSLLSLFKDKTVRIVFLKFNVLVFCQQFTGAPATIIYTQILFRESHCSYPQYLAIAYAIVLFICNVIGIFLILVFNKRKLLLVSTFSVILTVLIHILILYFNVNNVYWSYTSAVVLFSFIIVHSLGLGSVPVTLIPDLFPVSYRDCVTHVYIVFHSLLALLITKIFQILLTKYDVKTPFYLFLCISSFAFIFIYFFMCVETRTEVTFNKKNDKIKIDINT